MSELDELDRRILQQLQKDSSITNQELAEKVHASAPTCLRRVRSLHESGVIQKQVAIIDPQKIASTLTAIVEVTLDVQTAEANTAFEKEVNEETAVLQCYRVSTGPDFILVIQVADMQAYHELVHRLFTARKNVRNVRSFFSVNRSKFETYVNDL
ncbi:Lrp/AsnC family transcriptional regulator [Advenella sp. RU8]|uniref:Lrp/AsnC family transcriptional regulator n=1 Tax=Advenella sp. RU8 TaxID=3399575 RepID=UPI003AB01A1D